MEATFGIVLTQIGKWPFIKFRCSIHFCAAQAHMTIQCFILSVLLMEVLGGVFPFREALSHINDVMCY